MNSVLVVHVLVTKQNKEKKKDPGRPSNTNTENPPKQNNKQTVREITHHANDILTQKTGSCLLRWCINKPKLNYLKTSVKLCRLHLRIQNFGYALCWSHVYSNISKQVSEVYTWHPVVWFWQIKNFIEIYVNGKLNYIETF